MSGEIPYLVGFENTQKDGKGFRFNFVFSNGERSWQRDEGKMYYTHLMTVEAQKKIKIVHVYHCDFICGFKFFDKEHLPIWEIGCVDNPKW